MYIADSSNHRIRKVTVSTGIMSTIAGSGGTGSYSGDGGQATSAALYNPYGVAVDLSGIHTSLPLYIFLVSLFGPYVGNVYIGDRNNHRIRKVTLFTGIISTIAGTGTSSYSGDNGPATSAALYIPRGIIVDSAGNVYIADQGNQRIRKITIPTGIISTIAGSSTSGGYSGDNGAASSAVLNSPQGVAVDSSGISHIDYSSDSLFTY